MDEPRILKGNIHKLTSLVEKMLVNHYPYQEIKELLDNSRGIDKETSKLIYRIALDRFSSGYSHNRNFYINQTITRYEYEVRRLLSGEYGDGENSIAYKMNCFLLALDTMKDLEHLVGFRSTRTKVRINNIIHNRKLKIESSDSDFSKLNQEEQVELFGLIEKAKLTDLEKLKSIKKSGGEGTGEVEVQERVDSLEQFTLIKTVGEEEYVSEDTRPILQKVVEQIQINQIESSNEDTDS